MSSAEIAALQAALAAEHAASFAYGVIGANLSGSQQHQARTDWVAHQVARDELTAMINAAGGRPVPSAVGYQLEAVHSAEAARDLATTIEYRVAAVYLGMVALTDIALREFGARQARAAALRATSWSGSTVAFPGWRQ